MTDNEARILVYGIAADDRRFIFLEEGGAFLHYRLKRVSRDETDLTIGALLESPERPDIEVDPDGPSLLLFADLPEPTMQQLLGALRDNQMRIDLKAVVTATNRAWPLKSLLQELADEHELMRAWHDLAKLTQKADLLLMEPAVLLDRGGFEAEVEATKRFLKQQSDEPMTLETLIEKKERIEAHLIRLGY